jgi:hypothetical protein
VRCGKAPEREEVLAVERRPGEAHLAGAGPVDAEEEAEQGRLAGAARAEHRDALAGADGERDGRERLEPAVGDAHLDELGERRGGGFTGGRRRARGEGGWHPVAS